MRDLTELPSVISTMCILFVLQFQYWTWTTVTTEQGEGSTYWQNHLNNIIYVRRKLFSDLDLSMLYSICYFVLFRNAMNTKIRIRSYKMYLLFLYQTIRLLPLLLSVWDLELVPPRFWLPHCLVFRYDVMINYENFIKLQNYES